MTTRYAGNVMGRMGRIVVAMLVGGLFALPEAGLAADSPATTDEGWQLEEIASPEDDYLESLEESSLLQVAQAEGEDDAEAPRRRRRRAPTLMRPGGSRQADDAEAPTTRERFDARPDEAATGEIEQQPEPSTEGEPDTGTSVPEPQPVTPIQPRDRAQRRSQESRLKKDPDYTFVPLQDRWRIVEAVGVNERWYDPYNQNTLKGDRALPGTQEWFVNLSVVLDSIAEFRRTPLPKGISGTNGQGADNDIFSDDTDSYTVASNLITSVSFTKGETTFRPPDWEFRATAVANINYTEVEPFQALRVNPEDGNDRLDSKVALQELFVDKHLWNKTDRFDFDSLRVGIQPFNADFRGFLFLSEEPGVRLFGNFANNRLQYNLAYFRRFEKDTNSGLNNFFVFRKDDVVIANLYYQDFPVLGFNMEWLFAYNRNREGDEFHYNENGFIERPARVGDARGHDYDAYYLGLAGDGHIDRLNLSFQLYGVFGEDDGHPIALRKEQDILSWFGAVEASVDFDWMRYKVFGLYAQGDGDPYDGKATGFDTILDNPNFAGADTGFWQRQSIPLIFGGGVVLSGGNSFVPSLRSSKIEGQSNFINPGLGLVGVGADFDILPQLRLSTNVSWLTFDNTRVLEILREQNAISREIGWDLSAAITYRPLFTNNIILRASGAVLLPGDGWQALYEERTDKDRVPYSVLANLIFTY